MPLLDHLDAHLVKYLDHHAGLIQGYTAEIARSQGLTGAVDRLCCQYSVYSALGVPIRRVPLEILAIMMLWLLGGPGSFLDEEGRRFFVCLRRVSKGGRVR